MVPPVYPDNTSYRLKGGYSSFELRRHMVVSAGNAPTFRVYQTRVLTFVRQDHMVPSLRLERRSLLIKSQLLYPV